MNIAAYMAAREIWDVDHMAKMALLALCARAGRYSRYVEVPIRQIAADLHVHYNTAERALKVLELAGYASVDNRPGKPGRMAIDLDYLHLCGGGTSTTKVEDLHQPPRTGGVFGENQDRDRPTARRRRPTAPETQPAGTWTTDRAPSPWVLDENGTAQLNPTYRAALTPEAIADCPYCDDDGHLSSNGKPVAQCTHERPPNELTVADIVGNGCKHDSGPP
jgi:hypothetical protein